MSSSNRGPLILIGVFGCLAVCLMLVIVGGVFYFVMNSSTPTPVAINLPSVTPPKPTSAPAPTLAPTAAPKTSSSSSASSVAPTVPLVASPTKPAVATTAPTAAPKTGSSSSAFSSVASPFGAITFAAGVMGSSPSYKPVDTATHFPEGVTQVYSLISYQGPIKGTQWKYERYFNGKLLTENTTQGWDIPGSGATWAVLWNADGINAGDWEMRLYYQDQLVQKASFTVDAIKPGSSYFDIIRFAEDMKDDQPINTHRPVDNFKAGVKQVYAFFDAYNMSKTTKITREWYRNGELLITKSETWSGGQNEKNWWAYYFNKDNPLETGTYELKLYVDDKLVQLGTFIIEP